MFNDTDKKFPSDPTVISPIVPIDISYQYRIVYDNKDYSK